QLGEAAGGGGRFRLEPADSNGRTISGIDAAYCELRGDPADGDSNNAVLQLVGAALTALTQTNIAQATALSTALGALASGYGKVKPAKEAKAVVEGSATEESEQQDSPAAGGHRTERKRLV